MPIELYRLNRGCRAMRFPDPKGISPLVSGTLFVLITVVIATLVTGWLTTLSEEQAQFIRNTTQQRLQCQYADLFVENMVYNCSSNCITGVPHKLDATIKNAGSVRIDIDKTSIILNNGNINQLFTKEETLQGGTTRDIGFNAILISSFPIIPVAGIDFPPTLDTDTRGLWHFDEGFGTQANDESAYGNHGDLNTTRWASGKFGNAMEFNESHSRINISNSLSLDIRGNLTIEAWIKPNAIQLPNAGIICKGEIDAESFCLDVVFTDNYYPRFSLTDSFSILYQTTSSFPLDIGTWQHVAGVYNQEAHTIQVYLNKTIRGTAAFSGDGILPSINDIIIGNREAAIETFASGFNGTIDEVRISNETRTFSQPVVTSITLDVEVNYPSIRRVDIFSSSGLFDSNPDINDDFFFEQFPDIPVDTYRVEVEDASGRIFDKWYPHEPGGGCIDEDDIDRAIIASTNCPGTAYDAVSMINFEECVIP